MSTSSYHCYIYSDGSQCARPSCPTRRSSDLVQIPDVEAAHGYPFRTLFLREGLRSVLTVPMGTVRTDRSPSRRKRVRKRSEEHTAELQSRRDLVCSLLIEKKNTTRHT